MAVAAIVLNYKTENDVIRLVKDLQDFELLTPIVIDNSSSSELGSWCTQQDIHYENTGANLGYSGGNNVGLRLAKSKGFEYGFILNPDIELESLSIGNLAEILNTKKADIVFPHVLGPDGQPQTDVPTIENRILRITGEIPPLPEQTDQNLQYVDHGPGSAMLIRLSILDDIGYFREEFFMYGEEVEFCYRARRAGYSVAIYHGMKLRHEHAEHETLMSEFKLYYVVRNKLLRNKLLFGYSIVYSLLIIAYLLNYFVTIVRNRSWKLLRPLVLGILDGLQLQTGQGRY
jgi:GT2 family glycosyltransferase